MTVHEELLSKTEYVYVLGTDGKPQMPSKRKRHILKLLNTGKARIVEKMPFTVQLKYKSTPILVSPCGLGTREHSSRYHGFA